MKKWTIFLCALFLCHPAFAERITLKSGEVYEGKIIDRNDEVVTLETGGAPMYLPSDQISQIEDPYKKPSEAKANEELVMPAAEIPVTENPTELPSSLLTETSPTVPVVSPPSPISTSNQEPMVFYSNPKFKISFKYPQGWHVVDDPKDPDFVLYSKKSENLVCAIVSPSNALVLIEMIPLIKELVDQPSEVYQRFLEKHDWKNYLGELQVIVEPTIVSLNGKKLVYIQMFDPSLGIISGTYHMLSGPVRYTFVVGDTPQNFEQTKRMVDGIVGSVEIGDLTEFYSQTPSDSRGLDWPKILKFVVFIGIAIFYFLKKIFDKKGNSSEPASNFSPSIPVTCRCGAVYDFRNDFAGKLVQCTQCGAELQVPGSAGAFVSQAQTSESGMSGTGAQGVFERNKYFMNQKIGLSEKYFILDEAGQNIIYVERPLSGRNILAALAGISATIVSWFLVPFILFVISAILGASEWSIYSIEIGSIPLSISIGIFVFVRLAHKRHIYFYRDESKAEQIMEVQQDHNIPLIGASYTVLDQNGVLAKFKKHFISDFFRKKWIGLKPDESLLLTAKEDSFMLSLIRRFLPFDFLDWMLRTNFIICRGNEHTVIGEFNRKFSIRDKYVLDLTADPSRWLDRRIALALAVLLDTGERR